MISLVAANRQGCSEIVTLEVNEPPLQPWLLLRRADGSENRHYGPDLFECLKDLRHTLEKDGLLLCCQGARPLVFPSGVSRQMGNGRMAYPLRRVPPLSEADLIDIFQPADVAEVGTVEEQTEAVRKFFGFR